MSFHKIRCSLTYIEGIHINKQKKIEKSGLAANIRPPATPPAARVLTCYLQKRVDTSDCIILHSGNSDQYCTGSAGPAD